MVTAHSWIAPARIYDVCEKKNDPPRKQKKKKKKKMKMARKILKMVTTQTP